MTEMDVATRIAARVCGLLVERQWTLAVAESCTGGLISHSITNVPGSSEFFLGGLVAYANEVKRDLLGVSQALLDEHGAVSRETALAMAEGVRRLFRADVAIAVTGIAGPTGGTPTKPVGTTYVAVSTPTGSEVRHHRWTSDRLDNKRRSAEAALALLEEWLAR